MNPSFRPVFPLVILGSCLAALLPLAAQTYTASPILDTNYAAVPYSYTGLLRTAPNSDGALYSGSGAVVKNPRVVYSCAHLVFERTAIDPWLTGIRWHRAWASGTAPSSTGGQLLRSYYFFLGYASAAKISESNFDTFAMDFVVHYAYEVTANGGYAGVFEDGGAQLRSTRTKLITGYPSGNYPIGDSRRYLMHNTGPFSRSFTVRKDDYHGIAEVATGSGNSGGPVWVTDGTQYGFAGVLVSGLARSAGDSTDSAGVFAIDSSSPSLIEAVIAASERII